MSRGGGSRGKRWASRTSLFGRVGSGRCCLPCEQAEQGCVCIVPNERAGMHGPAPGIPEESGTPSCGLGSIRAPGPAQAARPRSAGLVNPLPNLPGPRAPTNKRRQPCASLPAHHKLGPGALGLDQAGGGHHAHRGVGRRVAHDKVPDLLLGRGEQRRVGEAGPALQRAGVKPGRGVHGARERHAQLHDHGLPGQHPRVGPQRLPHLVQQPGAEPQRRRRRQRRLRRVQRLLPQPGLSQRRLPLRGPQCPQLCMRVFACVLIRLSGAPTGAR